MRNRWDNTAETRPGSRQTLDARPNRLSARLLRRVVARGFCPTVLRGGDELDERPLPDRLAQARHEVLVVGQDVPGQEHRPQNLVRADEMVQTSLGIGVGGDVLRGGVERLRIVRVTGVFEVEAAE